MTASQLLETPFIKKAQSESLLEGIVNEAIDLISQGALFKNVNVTIIIIIIFFFIFFNYLYINLFVIYT